MIYRHKGNDWLCCAFPPLNGDEIFKNFQAEKSKQGTSTALSPFSNKFWILNQVPENYFDFFCWWWRRRDRGHLQPPKIFPVHSKTHNPAPMCWWKKHVQPLHKIAQISLQSGKSEREFNREFMFLQSSKIHLALEVLITAISWL